jgi:hypothetical protein
MDHHLQDENKQSTPRCDVEVSQSQESKQSLIIVKQYDIKMPFNFSRSFSHVFQK